MGKKLRKIIRERLILSAITAIVALIILTAIFFTLGIRINFLINDELKINLEPLDKSVLLHYNESIILNFTVINDNFMFCKSYCEYTLSDLSTGNIMQKSSQPMKSDEKIILSYDLTASLPGSGQKLYQFEARCSNIKSFLCRSDEKPRYKTSLITFNYDLTEQEKVIKAQLNASLNKYVAMLRYSDIKVQENSFLLSVLISKDNPEEVKNLASSAYDLENEFIMLQQQFERYLSLWKNERYIELSNDFTLERLSAHIEASNLHKQAINSMIQQHNDNIETIKIMLGTLEEINRIRDYYRNINTSTESLERYHHSMEVLYSNISQRSFESYAQIRSNINSINKSFFSITSEFEEEKRKELSLGNTTILRIRNEIERLSNISLNLTGSVCDNINISVEALKQLNASNNTLQDEIFEDAKSYTDKYCSMEKFNDTLGIESMPLSPIDTEYNFSFASDIAYIIPPNTPQCCIFNRCRDCCTFETCRDESIYPIIFLHGHAINKYESPESSLSIFAEMQKSLQEAGIINAGEISLTSKEEISFGELGRSGQPVSFRASYYYLNYFDLGRYHITTQKSERIENYALRLRELIESVKHRTGFGKVNIIAHSMGGLVAREYIALFGDDNINKLILIATPNHGIQSHVKSFCNFIGSSKECEDMSSGSVFLKRLNADAKRTPKTYTIAGTGCNMDGKDGDGIVLAEDVQLGYAENFQIAGKCTDRLQIELHNRLVDPEFYPEVSELVKEILKSSILK